MTSYCDYCNTHAEDTFNKVYHDSQYGFPLQDDHLLFERLILEINEAGPSWIAIIKSGEIVNEFLMSTGYLLGAHDPNAQFMKLSLQSVRRGIRDNFKLPLEDYVC